MKIEEVFSNGQHGDNLLLLSPALGKDQPHLTQGQIADPEMMLGAGPFRVRITCEIGKCRCRSPDYWRTK